VARQMPASAAKEQAAAQRAPVAIGLLLFGGGRYAAIICPNLLAVSGRDLFWQAPEQGQRRFCRCGKLCWNHTTLHAGGGRADGPGLDLPAKICCCPKPEAPFSRP